MFLFLVNGNLFSYNNYPVEKIKTISIGKGKEQLGHSKDKLPTFGFIIPATFSIYNNKIFINDTYNSRMQIFNLNLDHIGFYQIHFNRFGAVTYFIIDNSGEVFGVSHNGLIHLSKEGEKISFIANNMLTESIKRKNFFVYKNQVLSYNNDGTIYNVDLAEELKSKYPNTIKNDKGLQDKFDFFVSSNNFITKGNRLLNSDSYSYVNKYFNFLRNNIKEKKIKDRVPFLSYEIIGGLIGFDKNDNVYWQGLLNKKTVIVIYSKYGEILDCFYDPIHPNSFVTTRVAESTGDVYHWDIKPDGVTFYRTKNTWDPIDIPESPNTPTPPKALSITATCFIDWKNTYIPAKAFDGNLKSGWLEAAKGPGIGESITLTLDRTIIVDEIAVAPGYFNPKWWKSNNRVKDLRITYCKTSQVLSFKDAMKMQKIKLPKEIQFSEITFEIAKVYPSEKDDDTGISEIEFYYKGKKVDIDVSGVM